MPKINNPSLVGIENSSLLENLMNILTRENFLHLVETDSIKIEEIKNKGKKGKEGKLQEVIIRNIPYDRDEISIWQFNLEKKIKGISPIANKTVETALAYFDDSVLTVFLIEMKSSLPGKKRNRLSEIKNKIEDSISRFCFLLLFFLYNPSELVEKGVDFNKFEKSETKFRGIVFFNNKTKINKDILDTSERIYKVFKGEEELIECEPILGRRKIPLRFHKNPNKNQESFEISFDEL